MASSAYYRQSSLSVLSPVNRLIPGTIYAVLKAYFDGSVIKSKRMTLACIAADEPVWVALESAWEDVRKNRGNPSQLHMTDAMSLEGEFKAWSAQKRDWLVDGFIQVLTAFRNRSHLHSFTCTVDLESHARWNLIRNHPSPARLCARLLFPSLLRWYDNFDQHVLERIELVFDRDEPYQRQIEADWRNKEIRRRYPLYEWVRSITSAAAIDVPALQMADMVAWGTNRLQAGSHWKTDSLYAIAQKTSSALPGIQRIIDERTLAKSTFPEEGYEAINPQRRKQMKHAEVKRLLIRL
jgi:hypothetical protein